MPLNELPYFKKIYELFKYLHDGYSLVLKMEIQGESVFTANITSFERESYIEEQYCFFSFIHICRTITRMLNVKISYKTIFAFHRKNMKILS